MVPLSKYDLDSVEKLSTASDDEVLQVLPQLLEWLQDCNWPVFPAICKRVAALNEGQEEHIRSVLKGNDIIWKCNVIGLLFPLMPLEKVVIYKDILKSIIDNSSREDAEEGLIDYAEEQLLRIKGNT
ncbi:MAG: DUF5071 domain-containing protein [Pseudoalteromonas sp.]|uniref:DUF5071 domain-containing protein n=1 Tax=Pseudoalteromonas sp. TaxID=53249 RepID=UPI001DAB8DD5|nr:DUF5071 domain-containing protein [Pseudoalteromonas sp.]NRA81593.1 DUF5071 domain-containing protein [Pseudoalteromonas sp.]